VPSTGRARPRPRATAAKLHEVCRGCWALLRSGLLGLASRRERGFMSGMAGNVSASPPWGRRHLPRADPEAAGASTTSRCAGVHDPGVLVFDRHGVAVMPSQHHGLRARCSASSSRAVRHRVLGMLWKRATPRAESGAAGRTASSIAGGLVSWIDALAYIARSSKARHG
jgi:hypothetical protein